jgi:hypothetical protein
MNFEKQKPVVYDLVYELGFAKFSAGKIANSPAKGLHPAGLEPATF